jgi:hypothetical protein
MRNRKRRKHWPAALFCPIHDCLMKVRCVVGQRQYRYCPVAGCHHALQTERAKLPRPRKTLAPASTG